jgi:hypothetical protein
MPKRKNTRTAKEDRAAFIAAARELGCAVELPETFDETIRALAAMPPMSNAEIQKRVRQAKKKPRAK